MNRVLAIAGGSGSGKSTLARALSASLGQIELRCCLLMLTTVTCRMCPQRTVRPSTSITLMPWIWSFLRITLPSFEKVVNCLPDL